MRIANFRNRAELKRCLSLFIKVFSEPPFKEKWTRSLAFERLSQFYLSGRKYNLYAEENKRVLGFINAFIFTWEDGKRAFVWELAVDRNSRSKGVGKALVLELERRLRKDGISAVETLNHERAGSRLFWKKLGYEPTGYFHVAKKLK